MDIKNISETISVSPQITDRDLAPLRALGFRSIICNRPDGEEPDQPPFAEVEKAARAAGIEARYIPVIAGDMKEADVTAFGKAMAELPVPILAYCRSGARAANLWAAWQAQKGASADA